MPRDGGRADLMRPVPRVDYRLLTDEILLANQFVRLNTIYKVVNKKGVLVDFVMKPEQYDFFKNMHNKNLILKSRQLGFCLDPATRVLTSDLRWLEIQDLEPGDKLVGVEEYPPEGCGQQRHMLESEVQAVVGVTREAFRITFDDGRSVVCTAQHPWLSCEYASPEGKRPATLDWRSIAGVGDGEKKKKLRIGDRVRWITKPWERGTFEDGWFGGILDGEGAMAKSSGSPSICVSQRSGPVWERMQDYAYGRGYNYRVESDPAEPARPSKFGATPVPKMVFGRVDEMFRLMGQTRPERFIRRKFWDGKALPGRRNGGVGLATIVAIEPVGEQRLIDLQTSTGTYIAEGFVSHNTTLVQIYFLDQALFNDNISCGVIAHNKEDAEKFFSKKIKLAYDNIPADFKRKYVPDAEQDAANQLKFDNGSYISVGTSMRSDTLQYLHISEYGKLCAKFPEKAAEVQSGALNAVEKGGVVIIESTAEGAHGHFFDLCTHAKRLADSDSELSPMDYKFFFYPWWLSSEYRLTTHYEPTDDEHRYFKELAEQSGIILDQHQRNWYVAKSREQSDKMWREYPSTPDEAFRGIIAGAPLSRTMAMLRREGRITRVPHARGHLVHTFWDLGRNDKMAIWFMQHVGFEKRFIDYHEDKFWDLSHYAKILNEKPYTYGTHHLPHDAEVIELTRSDAMTREEVLRAELLSGETLIVPRVASEEEGVNMTRQTMSDCWFDEQKCAAGILCLEQVRYKFDERLQEFVPHLMRTRFKHGYDAFAQYGHGYRHKTTSHRDKSSVNEWGRSDRMRKQGAPALGSAARTGNRQNGGQGRRSGVI
jgi:hypothetical protein